MLSIESFERESRRQWSVTNIINLVKRNGKLSNLAPRCSFLIHERNGNALKIHNSRETFFRRIRFERKKKKRKTGILDSIEGKKDRGRSSECKSWN